MYLGFLIVSLFQEGGGNMATSTFTKQFYVDKKKADEISIYGIFLSMIIGLISSCFFCIFSYNILSVYNVESNVLEKASIYLQIVGIGLVFQSLMIVLTAIVQSYERARSSMYISIFANIVNIGIDLYFIFIIQPGENIGIMCVACSTVFSQFLASFILLFFCNKHYDQKQF